jgi:hypothetical protein
VASLLLQSYQAIWNRAVLPGHEVVIAVGTLGASLVYGFVRSRPGTVIRRTLTHPPCVVEIRPGDLFDAEDSHLVIGFSDTFDTDTTDDRVIRSSSIQGQFLQRVYGGNLQRLDDDLCTALLSRPPVEVLTRDRKPHGALARYPIGTVAVLGSPRHRYFCVAYSRMREDLIAESSSTDLWLGLNGLWDAVYRHGQRDKLAMPVVGSGLARIDPLDRASLIRLICLSFVAASRQHLLTHHLTILMPKSAFLALDRLEIQAFLDSL